MSFELCGEASATDWLVEQGLPWDRLVARGPVGYPRYARVRFIPDPGFSGQKTSDVDFERHGLSEKEQVGVALEILSRYTTMPEECYFCMWNGWGTSGPFACAGAAVAETLIAAALTALTSGTRLAITGGDTRPIVTNAAMPRPFILHLTPEAQPNLNEFRKEVKQS
ncbi:hypothetical protein AB0H00_27795 [Nocardia sp. NPDC023852]|uniref:hypothetical protein n=1 Tax=Nocardia sp. NPDC023852 TaxID=3154697 RepID=UPI0033F27E78